MTLCRASRNHTPGVVPCHARLLAEALGARLPPHAPAPAPVTCLVLRNPHVSLVRVVTVLSPSCWVVHGGWGLPPAAWSWQGAAPVVLDRNLSHLRCILPYQTRLLESGCTAHCLPLLFLLLVMPQDVDHSPGPLPGGAPLLFLGDLLALSWLLVNTLLSLVTGLHRGGPLLSTLTLLTLSPESLLLLHPLHVLLHAPLLLNLLLKLITLKVAGLLSAASLVSGGPRHDTTKGFCYHSIR